MKVNKCRRRCLKHCCSTLRRNCWEHRAFLSTQGTDSTWCLQWRWDCGVAQLQVLPFYVTANYNTYRNQQKPGWQTGKWFISHTPYGYEYNNALSWEEREGKRTSTSNPHHQTCKCAAMHKLTYCRKRCLKKLHCSTQSTKRLVIMVHTPSYYNSCSQTGYTNSSCFHTFTFISV